MPQKQTGEIALHYVRKYPETATSVLARMMVADYPELYSSTESARSLVRYYRGASGRSHRKKLIKSGIETPNADPRTNLPPLPEPVRPYDLDPLEVEEDRVLVLSDMQVPYHDPFAIEAAVDCGIEFGAQAVIVLGDLIDFYEVSVYDRDPTQMNLAQHLEDAKRVLEYLRAAFPDCPIILKEGNHEERWTRWLYRHAPEVVGIEAFELDAVLDLDSYNVALVDRMRPIKVGPVLLFHGHEFAGGVANLVNPARGLSLRTHETAMCAHSHRTSEHIEKTASGDVKGWWSIGCLCDMNPHYAPYNKWNQGFATIETAGENLREVRNHKVFNGRVA